jgi:hypothetical protein
VSLFTYNSLRKQERNRSPEERGFCQLVEMAVSRTLYVQAHVKLFQEGEK